MKRRNEIVLAAAVFAVVLLVGTRALAEDSPPAPPFPTSTLAVATSTTDTSTDTTTTSTTTAKETATTATSGPVETGAILLLGGVAFISLKRYYSKKRVALR